MVCNGIKQPKYVKSYENFTSNFLFSFFKTSRICKKKKKTTQPYKSKYFGGLE